MRIWFDVLTPKQILFFESMMERLGRKHEVLCTTRDYRELNGLVAIRGSRVRSVGRHGGAAKESKLRASIDRIKMLIPIVEEFEPDVTVSFCSPDAARVSFALEIPHVGFSEAPHHNAGSRLSVPLLDLLLIPSYIPKRSFTVFGIDPDRILKYDALDVYMIVKNRAVECEPPIAKRDGERIILFRTYETQAAYVDGSLDTVSLITDVAEMLPWCSVVVLGRYADEIRHLRESLGGEITVVDRVVDSRSILEQADVFVGSGGTMTAESALRGVPTISYNAVPYPTERYLVRNGLVRRAEDAAGIARAARRFLSSDGRAVRERAARFLAGMEDPGELLERVIDSRYGAA